MTENGAAAERLDRDGLERQIREETTLHVRNLSKTFGSNRALSGVSLTIRPGEIHGLLGQNGCGKSTLIKILSGFHAPDKGGELWINGEPVPLPLAPGAFARYGMSFVHQDLGLVLDLTVAENWAINEIAMSNRIRLDWNAIRADASRTFAKYNVEIDPNETVANIGPVQRAMLAILRAVEEIRRNRRDDGRSRGLLVLDEPTVFLPRTEVDTLFSLVRRITEDGISVMFVSHDLDEVMELTDAFTVLRDGRNVGSGITGIASKDDIISLILGRKLQTYQAGRENAEAPGARLPVLRVQGMAGGIVRSTDFSAYRGEVLGITGLVGSGFEEIPYLLFGAVGGQAGFMEFAGKTRDLSVYTPQAAVRDRLALIPADRKTMGGVANLRIAENIMMQSLKHYNPKYLQHGRMREKTMQLVRDYGIVPGDPDMEFGQLSGGNAQKVLLAKWIQENPELLILHEPTQGIDIGARQAIYRLIENSVKNLGMTVLCSSSDYEQLEQICDRVLIFVQGRIVSELKGEEITKDRITRLCYETAVGA